MPRRDDRLNHIFDDVVPAISPTSEQTAAARSRLVAVMSDEHAQRRSTKRQLVPALAAAVAALVVVVTAVAPWNRVPAEAFLGELAEATRSITPQELPEGSYYYVARNELVSADNAAMVGDELIAVDYLLPISTEIWWQGDTERRETTTGTPVFFDTEMETFYYANELDRIDFVGETRTYFLEGVENRIDPDEWSTDPDTLSAQIRDAAETDTPELPRQAAMLRIAERLLNPLDNPPPPLRAAILDVLSELDLDQERLDNGHVTVSVTYDDSGFGTVRERLTFDNAGYLTEVELTTLTGANDTALPPGTVFQRLTQTPPHIVPEAGLRPNN